MAGDDDAPGAVVPAKELRCPNCGAPQALRAFATTRSLACGSCGAVIDTSQEPWRTVQAVEGAYKSMPVWPLGSRGSLDGITWELVGWCERSVSFAGMRYPWEEHLLYNPYEGFRYLVYQNGHFALITPLPGLPSSSSRNASYEGQAYKHYTTGRPTVDHVLGEFPWQMQRGDQVVGSDYVAPPLMLSSEEADGEVVWSRGRYLERSEVVAAFGAPGRQIPSPRGVHMCQPNPHTPLLKWLGAAFVVALLAWSLLTLVYMASRKNHPVWSGTVESGPEGISPEVTLEKGRTLELEAQAPLDNAWAFVQVVVVGPIGVSEQARYGGLECSYYHGVDGGESWSEGSQGTSEVIAGLPAGTYVLQLSIDPNSTYKGPVSVRATEDVTLWRFPCCSFFCLTLIPLLVAALSAGFEKRRWADSDHAG